jgi:hypothetical protein
MTEPLRPLRFKRKTIINWATDENNGGDIAVMILERGKKWAGLVALASVPKTKQAASATHAAQSALAPQVAGADPFHSMFRSGHFFELAKHTAPQHLFACAT